MSIFQKPKIKVGDVVIGRKKLSFGKNSGLGSTRYFDTPCMVLEIKDNSALLFFEQEGPLWYNLSEIERCYVKDEYPDRKMAKD